MDTPYMNFEVRENVKHFKDGQSFQELSSLELEPIVKVYESSNKIEVSGYLVLTGEFLKQEEDLSDWEEQFEQSDGIHYTNFFGEEEGEIETFQYQIPISFEIKRDRVKDVSEVIVLVENFDYDILSDEEMELAAKIRLLGIYPESQEDQEVDMHHGYFPHQHNAEDISFFGDGRISDDNEEKSLEEENQQEIVEDEVELDPEEADITIQNKWFKNFESKKDDTVETEEEYTEEVEIENKETHHHEIELEETATNEEMLVSTEEAKVEEEVEEEAEKSAKVKIGIQGKNRRKSEPDENKSSGLIYSLLGRNKKKETPYEEEKAEKRNEVGSVESANEKDSTEENVVLLEDYMKEKETEEMLTEVNEETVVNNEENPEEANKSGAGIGTKDMLFGLLQGNEEKRYKLKLYFVQQEDTLESISEKYGVKMVDIVRQNKLESQNLEQGQILYLPSKRKIE